jgi:putative ABC transport system permease protein
MARTVPYLPPVQVALIVGVVALTTAAGTMPPLWATLRGRYPS